jgi:hypothetical protein
VCRYGGNNSLFEVLINTPEGRSHHGAAVDVLAFSVNPVQAAKLGKYSFLPEDVKLLAVFRSSTTMTVTTDRNRALYQNEIVEVAYQVGRFDGQAVQHPLATSVDLLMG